MNVEMIAEVRGTGKLFPTDVAVERLQPRVGRLMPVEVR